MTDRARFDVILGDKVTPGARTGAASISAMERQLRSLNAEARSSSSALSRWGVQIRRDFGAEQRAIRSLTNTSYTLGRASGFSMQQWGAGTRAAAASSESLLDRMSSLSAGAGGLATTAQAAVQVAEGFGRIAYSAGDAYLSVARFREDSVIGMRTLLGSQGAANRSFGNALILANQTPLDPQDVIGMFNQLAAGGFSERELSPLASAAADIQAARGQTASDSLVRVFSQIRGLGRVNRGDITMQGISAGLNAGDIFGSIARQMNLGEGRAGIRAAEAAVAHGRVNDRIAIQAFLDSVRRRYDNGGELGTFAKNSSSTLTGAISNLRGAMFTLMAGLDLANTPGVKAFRDTILAVTGALDASSDSGKELRGVIIEVANVVGTDLFGGIKAADISSGIRDAIPFIRATLFLMRNTVTVGRFFVGTLVGVYHGVGLIARGAQSGFALIDAGITGVTERFNGAFNNIITAPDRLLAWGTESATAIVDGFVTGMESQRDRMLGAVQSPFEGVVSIARDVLDSHSPSEVFRALGGDVARGFELGIGGGSGAVQAAVQQLVAPRADAGVAGGRSGGTPTIIVNVDARGASADPQAIADMAVAKFIEALEAMNLMGATDATA